MHIGIALAVFIGALFGCVGLIYSRATRGDFDFMAFMQAYSLVLIAGAWAFLVDWPALLSGEVQRPGQLVLVMVGGGLFAGSGMLCVQEAMRRGHHGICWTVAQTAMVIPFVTSLVFFDEQLTATRALGMVCVLGSVVTLGMSARGSHEEASEHKRGWFRLALVSFLLLGMQQFMSSVPSQWEGWKDTARLRVPIYFTAQFVLYTVILSVRNGNPGKRAWRWAVLMAVIVLVGHIIMYFGVLDVLSKHKRVALAFPVITSSSIIVMSLFSIFLLRERKNAATLGGIALGVAGVMLLAF
jgi:drug/metabolite transporter (DMT)-like permease